MNQATSPDPHPARAGVQTLPFAIAAVLGIAGARLLLLGDRLALTGGILCLAAALAAAGVALGGSAYGPGIESSPDLSTRLGLGLLGGIVAGLIHGVLTAAAGWLGLTTLLGAGVDVQLSALEWWNRGAGGALAGLALGAFYPLLPGRTFLGRGAVFGLLLAAWQLFYVYPFRLELGFGGLAAGWGVVPLVVVGAVLAGVVAAWFVTWGRRGDEPPLSAPLVE